MRRSEGTPPSAQPLRRVLLVEDEADIRESLKQLLEASLDSVEVTTVASGPEALSLFPHLAPHLVISDYKMPGMTGLEVLNAVRASAPSTPRVLMTAFPDLDVALKAINEAHIQSFFAKPLDAAQIVHKVDRILAQEQERHQRDLAMARAMRQAAEQMGV